MEVPYSGRTNAVLISSSHMELLWLVHQINQGGLEGIKMIDFVVSKARLRGTSSI